MPASDHRLGGAGPVLSDRLDFHKIALLLDVDGPLIEKLENVIKDVGRENGFSAILRTDTPGLEYRREALDVTDLVVKTYNGKG